MTDIIRETTTTQVATSNPQTTTTPAQTVRTSAKRTTTNAQTTEYLIYFFVGALDILLAFRLVLKLLGASTASAFVRMIYGLSGIFIWPFEGIFRRAVSQGIETASVLEPATIVALIVYAVLAWGSVQLLRVLSGEEPTA